METVGKIISGAPNIPIIEKQPTVVQTAAATAIVDLSSSGAVPLMPLFDDFDFSSSSSSSMTSGEEADDSDTSSSPGDDELKKKKQQQQLDATRNPPAGGQPTTTSQEDPPPTIGTLVHQGSQEMCDGDEKKRRACIEWIKRKKESGHVQEIEGMERRLGFRIKRGNEKPMDFVDGDAVFYKDEPAIIIDTQCDKTAHANKVRIRLLAAIDVLNHVPDDVQRRTKNNHIIVVKTNTVHILSTNEGVSSLTLACTDDTSEKCKYVIADGMYGVTEDDVLPRRSKKTPAKQYRRKYEFVNDALFNTKDEADAFYADFGLTTIPPSKLHSHEKSTAKTPSSPKKMPSKRRQSKRRIPGEPKPTKQVTDNPFAVVPDEDRLRTETTTFDPRKVAQPLGLARKHSASLISLSTKPPTTKPSASSETITTEREPPEKRQKTPTGESNAVASRGRIKRLDDHMQTDMADVYRIFSEITQTLSTDYGEGTPYVARSLGYIKGELQCMATERKRSHPL